MKKTGIAILLAALLFGQTAAAAVYEGQVQETEIQTEAYDVQAPAEDRETELILPGGTDEEQEIGEEGSRETETTEAETDPASATEPADDFILSIEVSNPETEPDAQNAEVVEVGPEEISESGDVDQASAGSSSSRMRRARSRIAYQDGYGEQLSDDMAVLYRNMKAAWVDAGSMQEVWFRVPDAQEEKEAHSFWIYPEQKEDGTWSNHLAGNEEYQRLTRAVVQQAYEQVKGNTGGKNADYIPYLANIDKNLFGISVCLLNGQTITVGDFDYRFGIESVSKVHTAILILRQYGAQKVLEMIGADATGLPFNSIIAILLENDHPSTPLVNAGAISACSMVTPIGNSDKKWDAIVQNITDLCGSAPQLIEELYKSETATNFNNRSIAWLLKNYNRIYDDPNMSLDLYTRQCSLGVTAQMLSVAAGTVANGGVNPVTKKQVFDAELTPKITSMIATVGFYEHSGDWMYTSGIPAKTGVGGGVMGVLPGVFGVSAFAPPLDGSGNSVKAQLAIKYIMNKLGLNVFNGARVTIVD